MSFPGSVALVVSFIPKGNVVDAEGIPTDARLSRDECSLQLLGMRCGFVEGFRAN